VDRNLIWMKSHPKLGPADFIAWPRATAGLLRRRTGPARQPAAYARAGAHRQAALLALLVLVLVSWYRKPWPNGLRRSACAAWAGAITAIAWDSWRSGSTCWSPCRCRCCCSGASWLFAQMEAAARSRAVGRLVQDAGLSYYLVILQAMGTDGFARGHLRWKTARVLSVRRLLRAGLWVMLPLAFLSATVALLAGATAASQAYRVTGLVVTAAFFVFLVLILRAGRDMFDSAFYSRGHPMLSRVGWILLVAIVVAQAAGGAARRAGVTTSRRASCSCACSSAAWCWWRRRCCSTPACSG
jgi:hypothetical protein